MCAPWVTRYTSIRYSSCCHTGVNICVATTWISYRCVPCHLWCTHRTSLVVKKNAFSIFLWRWTIPLSLAWCFSDRASWIDYTGWSISRLTPLWGISRLSPLHPTNGMSFAPGSQYIVVGGRAVRNAWHGCHGRHLEGRQQAVRGIKEC